MAAPTSVRVEAQSMTTVILRWSYSGTAAIEIHRSTNGTDYAVADTVFDGETEYTDQDLDPATKYWYKLSDDAGMTFSDVVTVWTHACDETTVGTAFNLPRFDGEEQQAAELNALAERIEQALGENIIDPDQCTVCPEDGAIVLDCSDGCNSFVVVADENINSISINACGGEGPEITFVIPPGETIEICGWPAGFGFTGDECSQAPIAGGTNGRTVVAGGGAGVGGGAPVSKRGTQGLGKKKPKKPGKPAGGAGGAGGSDCECVPGAEGQLTIRCCTADCSLACGSTKKLRLRVCGGVGPYSLTHTGSVQFTGSAAAADGETATADPGQIVEIEPPANAGSGEAGTAYTKAVCMGTEGHTSGTNHSAALGVANYGCDDAFQACGSPHSTQTSRVETFAPAACDGHSGHSTSGGCSGTVDCGAICDDNDECECAKQLGTLEDRRSAGMISAGCTPCGLETGSVITATDAAGTSVAITLQS